MEDLYSGLAEAYGILTVLQFFQNYLSSFPLILPSTQSVKLYCDNQGVLDRIQSDTNTLYPRDTIQDDYPVFRETRILLQTLQPIKVQLLHVTGHQNEKKLKRPLTTPELLNVDCDARATQLNDTLPALPEPNHIMLPASYPHLQISQTIIIRHLQLTLQEAATQPDYNKYLCDKYNWNPTDTNHIQWHTFRMAYNCLRKPE